VSQDAFVFSREPNGPSLDSYRDDETFRALRNDLGYGNMRLHDLRHFAATRLIAEGVPVRTVSGRLGHANPSTTLSVYSTLSKRVTRMLPDHGPYHAESKEMRAKDLAAKPKKSTGKRS